MELPNQFDQNKPTDFDQTKLHNEINQSMTQRITVVTTAVTIFILANGWIINGLPQILSKPVIFLAPIILLVILSLLFFVCQLILGQMRVISSYLQVTQASNWEKHYQAFTDTKFYLKKDNDNLVVIIFAVLGLLTGIIPITLLWLYPLEAKSSLMLTNFLVGIPVKLPVILELFLILYLFLILGNLLFGLARFGTNVDDTWKKILKIVDPPLEQATDFDQTIHDNEIVDWERVRSAMEHENQLTNYRITWLLTSQGFLFAAFALVFQASTKTDVKDELRELYKYILVVLAGTGFLISLYSWIPLRAAQLQLGILGDWWKERIGNHSNNHPPIGGTITNWYFEVFTSSKFPFLFVLSWGVIILLVIFPLFPDFVVHLKSGIQYFF